MQKLLQWYCIIIKTKNTARPVVLSMFRTLGDLKKEDEKDGKKKTTSYTGGEKSGMAVENPDDEAKDIKSIIERAQKEGASGGPSRGSTKIKITLYRNGFCINDGEFRSFDKPENKKFLAEMKQGYVPSELREKYPDPDLDVGLQNKSTEDYKAPPPPSYIAFSGSGQSMGGTTSVSTTVNLSAEGFQVDNSKPTTTLTFRFHNGSTNQVTVNTTERTSNIYAYVQRVCPGKFDLVAGFPPTTVSRDSTVEDADLCDSRITQKPL